MDTTIKAAIIDTSALEQYKLDFIGLYSKIIPSFYGTIRSNNIQVLSHPVLDGEIRKHIQNSEYTNSTGSVQKSINRNKGILEWAGVPTDEIIKKLSMVDIEKEMLSAYDRFTQEASELNWSDPGIVFGQYFDGKAPFSETGNKKSEFPDAFVIASLKDYVEANKDVAVLVVTGDADWERALSGIDRVIIAKSIDIALKMIQDPQWLNPIIDDHLDMIGETLTDYLEIEYYNIDSFDVIEDPEIRNIEFNGIDDIVPMRISDKDALIKVTAIFTIDGYAEIEDDYGYYPNGLRKTAELSFKNAQATVDCELELEFVDGYRGNKMDINDARIDNQYGIDLDLSEADLDVTVYES